MSLSTSTKTGFAPILPTASDVETHDIAGTITSSPALILKASNKISSESVPLAQLITCCMFKKLLKSFSNCVQNTLLLPPTKAVLLITSAIAASISDFKF